MFIKIVSIGENSKILILNNTILKIVDLKINEISSIQFDRIYTENCHMEKIDNIESKTLKIENTCCSFKIKRFDKYEIYFGPYVNFFISRNIYRLLEKNEDLVEE